MDKSDQGFNFLKPPLHLGVAACKTPQASVSCEPSEQGGQKIPTPSAKTLLDILDLITILLAENHFFLPDNILKSALSILEFDT